MEKLNSYVVETNYDQIPEQGIAITKEATLDTLGVTLAAANDQIGKIITRYVRRTRSIPEAGVIGAGREFTITQKSTGMEQNLN